MAEPTASVWLRTIPLPDLQYERNRARDKAYFASTAIVTCRSVLMRVHLRPRGARQPDVVDHNEVMKKGTTGAGFILYCNFTAKSPTTWDSVGVLIS